MKFVILVVIIVSGPWNAATSPRSYAKPSPAPAPIEAQAQAHAQALVPLSRPLRSPKPALPAAVVPIAVAIATNPTIKNGVIHGTSILTKVGTKYGKQIVNAGGAVGRALANALVGIANKFRGINPTTVTNIVDSTALVPIALPVNLQVSGGGPTKKPTSWGKYGTRAATAVEKLTELTAQASNVGVSIASSAIQTAQAQAALQVSGTQTCSINTNSCPSGTSTTNGGFSFGSNLRITWLDKSTTCRENILNLADLRPKFTQNLPQFSLQANLNFKLHSHQLAVINCGNQKGFPKISLAPNSLREPKPTKLGSIPMSNANNQMTLAWKGLTWFTLSVINSCILDSFLTHMLLKGKLDSTYTRRNFLIPQNPGEAILTEMISQYRKLPFSTSVQNQKLANQNWKQLWIKTFEPEFKDHLASGQTIDYKGAEFERVIEKLIPSCTTFETHSCKCKENNAEKVIVKRFYMKILDLAELIKLSREGRQDYSQSISYPLTTGFNRGQVKTCNTCLGDFKIDFFFVPSSSFFIYFMFSNRISTPFTFSKVPKIFVAHEVFLHNKVAIFELGYVTCSTQVPVNGVTHQLSFQYFNNKFYYYDDLKGGELLWAPNPDLTIRSKQLKCGAVTYFRP